ncbi:MAG: hypothetical protein PHE21_03060 [Candidatus Dojkabacteria bacterium]|nr:hypothetical protein [Candidatus Dojkabacteria bacterium]
MTPTRAEMLNYLSTKGPLTETFKCKNFGDAIKLILQDIKTNNKPILGGNHELDLSKRLFDRRLMIKGYGESKLEYYWVGNDDEKKMFALGIFSVNEKLKNLPIKPGDVNITIPMDANESKEAFFSRMIFLNALSDKSTIGMIDERVMILDYYIDEDGIFKDELETLAIL